MSVPPISSFRETTLGWVSVVRIASEAARKLDSACERSARAFATPARTLSIGS